MDEWRDDGLNDASSTITAINESSLYSRIVSGQDPNLNALSVGAQVCYSNLFLSSDLLANARLQL